MLGSLRSNLRVVKLDFGGARDQNMADWDFDDFQEGESIDSLTVLTALEELELDTSCLFTEDADRVMGVMGLVNLLPPSIRCFGLNAGEDGLCAKIPRACFRLLCS